MNFILINFLILIALVSAEMKRNSTIVPFFMYDPNLFCHHCQLHMVSNVKHNHFPLALNKFANHPWRTTPDKAEIFFIPIPLDYMARGLCGKQKTPLEITNDMSAFMNASEWFPLKRHLVIANDWASAGIIDALHRRYPSLIFAAMENTFPQRDCVFGLGYTTYYAMHSPGRFYRRDGELSYHMEPTPSEARNTTYMVEFIGRAWAGRHYEDRVALMTSPGNFDFPVFITSPSHDHNKQKRRCTTNYDRCVSNIEYIHGQKIREVSNFSLTLRGDTPGSDRWQNSMAAGSIPIGVGASKQEILGWLPFQSIIPWGEIAVSIKRDVFRADPVSAVTTAIRSLTPSEIAQKQKLMRIYRPDYDWGAYNTRMSNNILIEARNCRCASYT